MRRFFIIAVMAASAMLTIPFYHPLMEKGVCAALKDLHNKLKTPNAGVDECLRRGLGG